MQAITSFITVVRLCGIAAAGSFVPLASAVNPSVVGSMHVPPATNGPSLNLQEPPRVYEWQPTAEDSLSAEARLSASAIRPQVERYLRQYSSDRPLVRRISRAVMRESLRQRVPPSLIIGVLLTENTTLRPGAESPVGALGLMQVMPIHAGARICDSEDLVDVDSNICHGTLILARNLRATATPVAALLRYNGCVRGTNTPDCHRYPGRVLSRASRVRHEILAGTSALAAVQGEAAPVQLADR